MSMTKEQQQALDDALVPREQRLTIGSCNYRMSTSFKPKKPTFQVALDVLSLTLFYPVFLITASVPVIYMQELWAIVSYHKHHIRFMMNGKVEKLILLIWKLFRACSDVPRTSWTTVPFFLDSSHTQAMKESEPYKIYHDLASGKVQPKPKYVRQSSRSKTEQAPQPSVGKKVKTTAKVAKSRNKKQPTFGLETLSNIALTKAEQLKLATKRSLIQTHSSHASGSGAHEGTGVTPGVPDVPNYDSNEEISWKSSDEDDDDDNDQADKDDDDDPR
ncbi:hypothetical protein Tco_0877379 [Tanacetum coccineum]|uniref:Uncharacterized protein n=1 Tax=Tanacetum coccineum TaxID=301880 RepID=A0ABQ5BY59_9ASTR